MKQILGSIGQVAERYASRKPEEDKDGGGYAGREALDDWFYFFSIFYFKSTLLEAQIQVKALICVNFSK